MTDLLTHLRREHKEAKELIQRLSECQPRQRAKLFTQLEAALNKHMMLEESVVYPTLVEELGDDKGEEANVEHQLAREGITQLRAKLDQPGFGAVLDMLRAGLEHHIKEEERELLPTMKERMDRDDWRALGEAYEAADEAARKGARNGRTPRRRALAKA